LFPAEARNFRGKRWLDIGLRSFHLVGIAGIGGGFLFDVPMMQYQPFWLLTLATGVFMSLLAVWSSATWLLQVKGLAIVCKLILLAIAFALPVWRGELFVLIILLSGVVAHAPGNWRAFSPIAAQYRGSC